MIAMVSGSIPSSHASIVSVDPAIASQICDLNTLQEFGQHAHLRTGSSPGHGTRTQETTTSRGHGRAASAPLKSEAKRSMSLRKAKDSTEVLRQRSVKSMKKSQPLDTVGDAREGRSFTVGNVGAGGKLYLRPSAHQSTDIPLSSPILMPLTAPANLPATQAQEDYASSIQHSQQVWSNPSIIRSASPKRTATQSSRRPTTEALRPRVQRSQSVSTLDERPTTAAVRSGALKIVINRPGLEAQDLVLDDNDNEAALPTLEVPIPHYRLGTPRFSAHGTPMLRSSAYSQQSSLAPSDANYSRRSQALDGRKFKGSFVKSDSSSISTIKEPVHPEIYDDLAQVYDDPTVVRYSQNIREITAATPARIIAQISSESFMDYELVSDFFLTFRSYMSTIHVLNLLMARLQWAIDRQEDDGRIIRVRTFAALRHWILNYFTDDFIPDQKLRIRFCCEINRMYTEVKTTPRTGTSDLKVLRDLKRCWNGRCSLFWQPEDFPVDGDQDDDLRPGGFEDIAITQVTEQDVYEESHPLVYDIRIEPHPDPRVYETSTSAKNKPHHDRHDSTGKQESVKSDSSLQPNSCSIPTSFRRSSDENMESKGPHPVSVQLRRKNVPANLRVATVTPSTGRSHSHRRGVSSIDSDREPTPRNLVPPLLPMSLRGGNLIRGNAIGPTAPFVQITAAPTTPLLPRFDSNNIQAGTSLRRGNSPSTAASPGVKNIFGSLRRALGGRHGQSDMTVLTVSAPMPVQNINQQRSNMPLNVSKSSDELRHKQSNMLSKGQVRIDLLCAAAGQSFEALFPPHNRQPYLEQSPPTSVVGRSNLPMDYAQQEEYASPRARRETQASHATAQSGSILIVDETGVEVPISPQGMPATINNRQPWQRRGDEVPGQAGLGIDHSDTQVPPALAAQRSSNTLGEAEMLAHDHFIQSDPPITYGNQIDEAELERRPPSRGKGVGLSIEDNNDPQDQKLSDQGSSGKNPNGVNTATHVFSTEPHQDALHMDEALEEDDMKLPTQGLRRRPGGDLRNVEKVQELQPVIHYDSFATTTTRSQSPHESLLIMGNDVRSSQAVEGGPIKPVSMINTHSSQHLRPSFEAAVAGFSRIPDDDDGGLEATLLKLEGKYDRASPPLVQYPADGLERRRSMPNLSMRSPHDLEQARSNGAVVSGHPDQGPRGYMNSPASVMHEETDAASKKSSIFGLPVASRPASDSSYNSLPLLKRDTDSAISSAYQGNSKMMPSPLHLQQGFEKAQPLKARQSAQEMQDNSLRPVQSPETVTESAQSFLLDEDENMSDLSSEISVDIINYSGIVNSAISPMLVAPGTAVSGLEIPSHPLRYASVVNMAPPLVEDSESSVVMRESQAIEEALRQDQPGEMLPTQVLQTSARITGSPAHIPFILACDSQVLAQQLTLIEKSALGEVEWSDLVEMRWSNNTPQVLDWAEFLAGSSIRGIDLVITRFNLVVKWVLSEIVLTQDISERAQVITKYIHVAAHARRLHNYATMLQLTIALTSTDCTKLTRTWAAVSGPDKSLLKNMETLVQPVRNFHDLRTEMESSDMSDGCIPFIGLYVHDLTYNAQKPAEVMDRTGQHVLVNFERHRTTALIVKGLLRLIDASSRYRFEPIEGIIDRCLWLATLKDDRIRNMSKALEKE